MFNFKTPIIATKKITTSHLNININKKTKYPTKSKNESKKCSFNPCQNHGACKMIDKNQFDCICKPFFYGSLCENCKLSKIESSTDRLE